MNEYYEKLLNIKQQLTRYLKTIFQVYGDELLLKLEDYNLLKETNNCIETSTSIGFILEEFAVSKLNMYTKNHIFPDLKVLRLDTATNNSSYDCFLNYNDMLCMINIKTEKETNSNVAVSAINKLYKDYVLEQPEKEKCYMVLKIFYKFDISNKDKQRKIMITGIQSYFLEEIDFSKGYKQDHRNWSQKKYNKNSGRLQITETMLENQLLDKNKISYEKTKQFIEDIYNL